jgi:hypothetical protein
MSNAMNEGIEEQPIDSSQCFPEELAPESGFLLLVPCLSFQEVIFDLRPDNESNAHSPGQGIPIFATQLSQPVLNQNVPDIPDVHHSTMWSNPCLQKLGVNYPGGLRIPLCSIAKLSLFVMIDQVSKENGLFALAVTDFVDCHSKSINGCQR